MKSKIILFTALVGLVLASSCKKDKTETPFPKIYSVTRYNSGGSISFITTYVYDNQGRLSRTSGSDGSYSTVDYKGSTVTISSYGNNAVLNETGLYYLNSSGLADSLTSTSYSTWGSTTTSTVTTITYKYDNAGFMVKSARNSVYGSNIYNYVNANTPSNSNITVSSATTTETYMGSTYPYVHNDTYTRQFLADKANSIGNANMGINFLGTQDANLVSSYTYSYSTTSGNVTTTTTSTANITYEYNDDGFVTKKILLYTQGSGTSSYSTSTVTSYTYR